MSFNSTYFKIATTDGRNIVLLEDVVYKTKSGNQYIIPKGAISDGASTPQLFWDKYPPFGQYWKAAILHDCAFQNTLLLIDGTPANLPFEECNLLFREGMESCGVDRITADLFFSVVDIAGRKYFDENRISGSAAYMADLGTVN